MTKKKGKKALVSVQFKKDSTIYKKLEEARGLTKRATFIRDLVLASYLGLNTLGRKKYKRIKEEQLGELEEGMEEEEIDTEEEEEDREKPLSNIEKWHQEKRRM